jgi:hypothetical protein
MICYLKRLVGNPWSRRTAPVLGVVAAALALAACGSGGKY